MPVLTSARAFAARAVARLRAPAPPSQNLAPPSQNLAPPSQNLAPPSQKGWRAAPYVTVSGPRWPVHQPRDYAAFAREGFMQNAIAYRSVRMIAEAVGHIPHLLYDRDTGSEVEAHPLKDLLRTPAPNATTTDLLEQVVGFLLVSGNAYIEAVATDAVNVRALYALRPDRMALVPGPDGWPDAYAYTLDGRTSEISGEAIPGVARIRHLKLFHPLDDHYGLSPLEAAAQAIDLHNTASSWNKALLDNSARPSGALVYTARDGNLTSDQFERLKRELESGFQGARNAGRPLLLEGGLDWKAMSLSPKDLDFMEAKNAAAREIALALGVPPMLLAIPGDVSYSNYQEATRAFWRGTVLPLATRIADGLSSWLAAPHGLVIRIDTDTVDALAPERDALWTRLDAATFLTPNEKRSAAGFDALPEGGDALTAKAGFNPGQVRVPAGSPGGGRWGEEGEKPDPNRHLVARTPRPPPRPPGRGHNSRRGPAGTSTPAEPTRPPPEPMSPPQAIDMYRNIWRIPPDDHTVAAAFVEGKLVVGVNSSAPGYTQEDRQHAVAVRGSLAEKYADVLKTDNLGQKPNNAMFHAEATLLLRAAREAGGSLSGRHIEMYVDNDLCHSCQRLLPYLARELGNPSVDFIGPRGDRRVLRDGDWIN